ncbi:hypothetical protein ScPMuIL_006175 [Solemya velum]
MKALNYEWKVVNPYHIRARNKNHVTGKFSKISLQLYQVDQKSYLLDFKSLSNIDHDQVISTSSVGSASSTGTSSSATEIPTRGGTSSPIPISPLSSSGDISDEKMEVDAGPGCHCTLEFFEMCANLISTLAR